MQKTKKISKKAMFSNVLVLAGMELIFFIVACMGLSFGFVLKSVFIARGRFRYHRAVPGQSQGLRPGGHTQRGGDTAGTADPS